MKYLVSPDVSIEHSYYPLALWMTEGYILRCVFKRNFMTDKKSISRPGKHRHRKYIEGYYRKLILWEIHITCDQVMAMW